MEGRAEPSCHQGDVKEGMRRAVRSGLCGLSPPTTRLNSAKHTRFFSDGLAWMTRKVVPATCRVLGIRPGQIGLINFCAAHALETRRGITTSGSPTKSVFVVVLGDGRTVLVVAASFEPWQPLQRASSGRTTMRLECIPALKPEPTSLWHRLAPLDVGGAVLVLECEERQAGCPCGADGHHARASGIVNCGDQSVSFWRVGERGDRSVESVGGGCEAGPSDGRDLKRAPRGERQLATTKPCE